uniref:hypothetical protein n=1 Tax=Streptosarcina costaricana TaxID=2058783 RepID=UPI00286C4C4D|nr:hypothetical protein RMD91_pgp080 [Streptosarcina costaricana]WKT08909.1 hypothetical protein [Streptosarcina costaricana]
MCSVSVPCEGITSMLSALSRGIARPLLRKPQSPLYTGRCKETIRLFAYRWLLKTTGGSQPWIPITISALTSLTIFPSPAIAADLPKNPGLPPISFGVEELYKLKLALYEKYPFLFKQLDISNPYEKHRQSKKESVAWLQQHKLSSLHQVDQVVEFWMVHDCLPVPMRNLVSSFVSAFGRQSRFRQNLSNLGRQQSAHLSSSLDSLFRFTTEHGFARYNRAQGIVRPTILAQARRQNAKVQQPALDLSLLPDESPIQSLDFKDCTVNGLVKWQQGLQDLWEASKAHHPQTHPGRTLPDIQTLQKILKEIENCWEKQGISCRVDQAKNGDWPMLIMPIQPKVQLLRLTTNWGEEIQLIRTGTGTFMPIRFVTSYEYKDVIKKELAGVLTRLGCVLEDTTAELDHLRSKHERTLNIGGDGHANEPSVFLPKVFNSGKNSDEVHAELPVHFVTKGYSFEFFRADSLGCIIRFLCESKAHKALKDYFAVNANPTPYLLKYIKCALQESYLKAGGISISLERDELRFVDCPEECRVSFFFCTQLEYWANVECGKMLVKCGGVIRKYKNGNVPLFMHAGLSTTMDQLTMAVGFIESTIEQVSYYCAKSVDTSNMLLPQAKL